MSFEEAYFFFSHRDGQMYPLLAVSRDSFAVYLLFVSSVSDGEPYPAVVRTHGEEHIFVFPVAEVENALPIVTAFPINPR